MDIEGISNLQMIHIKDLIEVYGNFSICTSLSQEELNNGTLNIHGDFWQGGQERSFDAVDKHKTYFVGTGEQHILFRYDETSQFANDDYAMYNQNVIWDNDPADWLDAAYYFCNGISNSVDLAAQIAELSEGLGSLYEAIREDPRAFALNALEKAGIAIIEDAEQDLKYMQLPGSPFSISKREAEAIMEKCREVVEYYSDSAVGKCQKIEKSGEAFGALCLLAIQAGIDIKSFQNANIKRMAEALEKGSKSGLAMAVGDTEAMGNSVKHLLTGESVQTFTDMTQAEARYLTEAVETLAGQTGEAVSDHLFAILRRQYEKGTSLTKAVEIGRSTFNKQQAAGRIYKYVDDEAKAALDSFVILEDVSETEIGQLENIARAYADETGQVLKKSQLDDLIGDSTLGEESVEEVVAGLVKATKRTFVASADKITPSMPKGSKPFGNYETGGEDIVLQNNAADLFASEGYHVEMLDRVDGGNGYGINKKKIQII